MKLDDPFGRIEAQHNADYEMLRKALSAEGVVTPDAVSELLVKVRKRTLLFAVVTALATGVLMLLFPGMQLIFAAFGVTLLIWVVTTHVNNRRLISRYRDELD